jgi:hypothetical protein
VPATEVVVVVAGESPPDVAEAVGELRLSAAGALPLKKRMYTNGPATAKTTRTTTDPMSQRSQ